MTISIPNAASTQVLAGIATSVKYHAVWFQNFSTTVGFNVNSNADADVSEFYLAPATAATAPTTLIIQSSGGDTTLVNRSWEVYQASGGAVNLLCGRW